MRCNLSSAASRHRLVRAYTLIEVMVAVLIFTAVFIGFYVNLTQGFQTIEFSRENLRATQLLEQQMETIRLYTWSQINSNGFVPTSFTAPFSPTGSSNGPVYTGTISITNAPMTESYASSFVLVTVTLTWTSDLVTNTHTRQMSTLVSEYGLHNYFY